MPLAPPPARATTAPRLATLPVGTRLWRVHSRNRSAAAFKPVVSDALFGGGRFDSTPEDRFPFLYAASDTETALLETLVRSIPFDDHGHRLIRRASVAGCRISALRVTQDLKLVSLVTMQELADACQDEWLVQADPAEYPQTRRWGHWLRSQAPWAHGLRWPSRRNLGHHAMILFGDRCPGGSLGEEPGSAVDLDDGPGAGWLNAQLTPYRIRIKPPLVTPPGP
jgi:RES domain